MTDWLGLELTDRDDNPLTDEDAIAYAAEHFGVPTSDIELERTDSVLLVRTISDDEVDVPTFEEWLQETYGTPKEGTPLYEAWRHFGYGNYLIRAYPEVFAASGVTRRDIYGHQHHLYYWHCMSLLIGSNVEDEITEEQLLELMDGLEIIQLIDDVVVPGVTLLEDGMLGVPVWDEDDGAMCLFCKGDDLIVTILHPNQYEDTDNIFHGWGDIEE